MSRILFLICLPWTVTVGWGWVLLAASLGLARNLRWDPNLVLAAEWTERATARWRYSTTIGRGIIYHPRHLSDSRIQRHEHVHVRQVEDTMTQALLVAAVVYGFTWNWQLSLGIWFSGGAWLAVHYLTAYLRYGADKAYAWAEHERSAYAQTDICTHVGISWQELMEKVEAARSAPDKK